MEGNQVINNFQVIPNVYTSDWLKDNYHKILNWDEKFDALTDLLLVLLSSKNLNSNLFICSDWKRNTHKHIKINSHHYSTTIENSYNFLKASTLLREKGKFHYS